MNQLRKDHTKLITQLQTTWTSPTLFSRSGQPRAHRSSAAQLSPGTRRAPVTASHADIWVWEQVNGGSVNSAQSAEHLSSCFFSQESLRRALQQAEDVTGKKAARRAKDGIKLEV